MNKKPKLLFFIGVDWFFYSHFLDRALAAKAAGYDVVVVTALTRQDDPLAEHGIKLVGIPLKRRSLDPMELGRNLKGLVKVLRQERPDIVHLIALKPIIIGSVACRILGIKRIVNAVVGLGFAFSSPTMQARVMRTVLSLLFHVVLGKERTKTVFENTDDLEYFVSKGWVRRDNAVLIRGAGVNTEHFSPNVVSPSPQALVLDTEVQRDPHLRGQRVDGRHGAPVVMLLSRMLWDKGIGEFVEAARLVNRSSTSTHITFVLVGDPDEDNRGTISREQLLAWQEEGVVQWWGYHEDVRNVLSLATISCLPSYREGLPKSLLESLAMGLPCIATDVPGCREAVVDGVNGFLVPPRDAAALAHAIERLFSSPDLLEKFGKASRQMAVEQFSSQIVNEQTLDLYRQPMPSSSIAS